MGVESSRQGADPDLANEYRRQNREDEIEDGRRQGSIEVGEIIDGGTEDEPDSQSKNPTRRTEIRKVSPRLDWFVEIEEGEINNTTKYITETHVLLTYNTDEGSKEKGHLIEIMISSQTTIYDEYGNKSKPSKNNFNLPDLSREMRDLIKSGINYHSDQLVNSSYSVIGKYLDFVTSTNEKFKNRLSATSCGPEKYYKNRKARHKPPAKTTPANKLKHEKINIYDR